MRASARGRIAATPRCSAASRRAWSAGGLLNGANQPPPPEERPHRVIVEEPEETMAVRPRREPVYHDEPRKVWIDDEDFTDKRVEVCE